MKKINMFLSILLSMLNIHLTIGYLTHFPIYDSYNLTVSKNLFTHIYHVKTLEIEKDMNFLEMKRTFYDEYKKQENLKNEIEKYYFND